MADRVPRLLADARVFTPAGESVRVGDVWREQTAVIALIRHFG